MDLHIRGNDVEITDEIRTLALRRATQLDRLVDRVVDGKLELRRLHQRTGGDLTVAQLTIQTRKSLLRAEERERDTQRAVDLVMDKMARQIRRYHDKRADRHGPRPGPIDEIPLEHEDLVDAEEADAPGRVVRTKRFSVKPMDPDEAIEQMELLGHDFYLFHNAQESQINVVYRRRDGSYGLLAPERS